MNKLRLMLMLLALVTTSFCRANDDLSEGQEKKDQEVISEKYSEDLQILLYQNYLEAEDNQFVFNLLASRILSENKSSLSSDELVHKFKDQLMEMPEMKNEFLDVISSHFTDEELKMARQLVLDENYLNLRQKIELANGECFMKTIEIFKDLAQAHPSRADPTDDETLLEVTQNNILTLLSSPEPLVIKVYTNSCAPCKYLSVVINELNQEYRHLYRFATLNAEEELELARAYKIRKVPTVLFIKNGREQGRVVGFVNKEKLIANLKLYFEDNS